MLAQLTGPTGRVEAYEIETDLAWRAAENLRGMPWVKVHAGSGTVGPLPVCDALYVSAGATAPLTVWLDALRMGGRLLVSAGRQAPAVLVETSPLARFVPGKLEAVLPLRQSAMLETYAETSHPLDAGGSGFVLDIPKLVETVKALI